MHQQEWKGSHSPRPTIGSPFEVPPMVGGEQHCQGRESQSNDSQEWSLGVDVVSAVVAVEIEAYDRLYFWTLFWCFFAIRP